MSDGQYDKTLCIIAAHLHKLPSEIREAAETDKLDLPDARNLLQIALGTPFFGEGYQSLLKFNPSRERRRKQVLAQLGTLDIKLRAETDPEKRRLIAQQMNEINTWGDE